MSIEAAKAFIKRMKTDADFAQQITKTKDAETLIEFVKLSGFDFSVSDIRKANELLSNSHDC